MKLNEVYIYEVLPIYQARFFIPVNCYSGAGC